MVLQTAPLRDAAGLRAVQACTGRLGAAALSPLGGQRTNVNVGAHWTTLAFVEAVSMPRRRVVHRAWLWTTRRTLISSRGVLSTTAKHPEGNPCSQPSGQSIATLTWQGRLADCLIRLPCPWGDCLRCWPFDGPYETCSPQGAGRPKRATGCSAKVDRQERRSVSNPRGLPTRQVIPQLAGVCL
jgi:hypothetical protein